MSSVIGLWFDKLTTNEEKAFRSPFALSNLRPAGRYGEERNWLAQRARQG